MYLKVAVKTWKAYFRSRSWSCKTFMLYLLFVILVFWYTSVPWIQILQMIMLSWLIILCEVTRYHWTFVLNISCNTCKLMLVWALMAIPLIANILFLSVQWLKYFWYFLCIKVNLFGLSITLIHKNLSFVVIWSFWCT